MSKSKKDYIKKLRDRRRAKIENIYYTKLLDKSKLHGKFPHIPYCLKYVILNNNGSIGTHTCKSKFCPYCRQKKRQKAYSILANNLDGYQKDDKDFLSLTLTIKNCEVNDLNKTIKKMDNGFKKLLTRKKFKLLQNPDIWPSKKKKYSTLRFVGKVYGYIKSLQITYSKKNSSAHPHFHIILACKPNLFSKNYISKNVLSLMWKEVLGLDYEPEVKVQKIKTTISMTQKEKFKKVFSYITNDSLELEKNLKTYGESFAKWLEIFDDQTKGMRYLTTTESMKPLLKLCKNDNDSEGKSELFIWDLKKKNYIPYPKKDHTPPLVADSLSIPLKEPLPKPLSQSCRRSNPQVSYSPSLPHERPYSESGCLVGRSIDSSTP